MSDKIDELIQDILGNGITDEIGSPEFQKKIEEAQRRRDTLFENQAKDKTDYGFSLQNPIMTSSVRASDEYLSRLRTADGLELSWDRIGSYNLESLYGIQGVMVDCYQLILDGDNYRKIYICPYGRDADVVPRGMYLASKNVDKPQVKETVAIAKDSAINETSVPVTTGEQNIKSDKTIDNNDKVDENRVTSGSTFIKERSTTNKELQKVEQNKEDKQIDQKCRIELINCSKCRAQIRKDARYCRLCGTPNLNMLQNNNGIYNDTKKKDYSSRNLAIVIIFMIVFCGAIYWYVTSVLPKQAKDKGSNYVSPIATKTTVAPTATPSINTATPQTKEKNTVVPEKKTNEPIPGYQVGKIIVFGVYEQDNNTKGKEPLEWIVIKSDKESGYIQLITRNVIDSVPYAGKQNAKWSNSSVREWLNEDFLNTAFSASERKYLIPADVKDNNGATSTTDKVFLLTYDSVESYLPTGNLYRLGKPTNYVKGKKQLTVTGQNTCSWGTRDPEIKVSPSGEKQETSANTIIGVRPSVYVRIDDNTPIISN
ncbi:MAG: zinc ribbon domain-containing protein [Clostridia bacterium]|nr:zinc ribbon domain-containing protein [Clostridia bacterium]